MATDRIYPELHTGSVSLRLPDDLDACIADRELTWSGSGADSALVRVWRLTPSDREVHVCFGFDLQGVALVGTPGNVRRLLTEALDLLDAEAAREGS